MLDKFCECYYSIYLSLDYNNIITIRFASMRIKRAFQDAFFKISKRLVIFQRLGLLLQQLRKMDYTNINITVWQFVFY